jgi:hypothetical protein
MRAHHAELLGGAVHELGERLLGAGDAFGERDRRIVAALHDHAENQGLHGHRFAEFDEAAGPFRAPGLLADRHGIVELELARGELPEHDVGGHELGQAGRLEPRHRILGGERLVRVEIDDDVRARIDVGRTRNRRIGGRRERGAGR